MIKIRIHPIFATALLGLAIATQTLFADAPAPVPAPAPAPWLDLVRQRLELEQANPNALVINKRYSPEDKKHALDHALVFYRDRFQKFYKDAMVVIDPCKDWCDMKDLVQKDKDKRKLECKEWCDLKDYLDSSKRRLDEEFTNLKQRYRSNLMRTDVEDNKIKNYEADLKHYYEDVIDVFKKTIIDGQKNEVKLLKDTIKEKRQERAKEKRSDDKAILNEEE